MISFSFLLSGRLLADFSPIYLDISQSPFSNHWSSVFSISLLPHPVFFPSLSLKYRNYILPLILAQACAQHGLLRTFSPLSEAQRGQPFAQGCTAPVLQPGPRALAPTAQSGAPGSCMCRLGLLSQQPPPKVKNLSPFLCCC